MTPRIALLVIGDGRDELRRVALDSFDAHARNAELAVTIEVDDRAHRLGFCGAIREGWDRLRAAHETHPFDYVFHLEEDWRILRDVEIDRMADLLDVFPELAQVALRRGPEPGEHPDGPIGAWPDEYLDKTMIDVAVDVDEITIAEPVHTPWLEHGLFFTTNPSLYRESLLDNDWPEGPGCERVFGERLRDNGQRFAFWGARHDTPLVLHTGQGQRQGRGY